MITTTLTPGQKVTVKLNGDLVDGIFKAPSTKLPGYCEVEVDGKIITRKVSSRAAVETVIPDTGVINRHATTEIIARVQTFDINTRFGFLERMVDMVIDGPSVSLVICGDGGLGKSYIVRQRLAHHVSKDGHDHVIIKGSTTPKALYRTLYNNRDKVIVFDDCDSAFKDVNAINLLKAALETDPNEPRRCSWLTEREDEDLPNSFIFTGKIILISNIKMTTIPQALLSRSLHVDVSMTADEKIARLRNIAGSIAPNVPVATREECLNLMNELKDQTADLNIRTFQKVIQIWTTQPADLRKDMATYVLTSSAAE